MFAKDLSNKIFSPLRHQVVCVHGFTGSKVQGFKGAFSSLDWIWDAYLQTSVSFVRPNPKFGVKLAIIWEMSNFNEDCGPSLFLTLNVEP
jgi:hypothetical protein